MDEKIHETLQQFATTLIQQDWEKGHAMLAPWLQSELSAADLEFFFREPIQTANEEWELPEDCWPGTVELDLNPDFPLSELRGESAELALPADVPAALTEDNYRGWYCISLLTREDQDLELDGWCDLWLALSEDGGKLGVAYMELHELD
ncbi:MAG: hypothetical protein ACO1RX_16680 [Candidatus Sericytochromatia bacterium]